MKFHYTLIFALLFIGLFDACRKQDEYPIEPVIEMSVKQIYQNPSVIVISFTDGDGDVGFNEGDTLPPYNFNSVDFNKYYYNLLLYYFEKNDGVWEEIELIVPYYYRIPYLTPSGQNKSLKGEIEVSISLPASRPDSIRFDIELIDRALHSSNILTSPVIYK